LGVADFGLVRPGNYTFRVSKKWDLGLVYCRGQLTVDPGSRVVKPIVCPQTPLERVAVRIRADWPPDLQKEGLVLYARFFPRTFDWNGLPWEFGTFGTSEPSDSRLGVAKAARAFAAHRGFRTMAALIGPDSATTEVAGFRDAYLWKSSAGPCWADLPADDIRESEALPKTLACERGAYALYKLLVLRPAEVPAGAVLKRFELLALAGQSGPIMPRQPVFAVRYEPPVGPEENHADRGIPDQPFPGRPYVQHPPDEPSPLSLGRFEAKPGDVNEWTIPLWDALLATVRESLKASKAK
jgi:hypothetical protein